MAPVRNKKHYPLIIIKYSLLFRALGNDMDSLAAEDASYGFVLLSHLSPVVQNVAVNVSLKCQRLISQICQYF